MIEVNNLSKRFGSTLAVDDVSFKVERGEIVGFLGPNGAGKSTTMKMLTCFLAPTEGTASIDGYDIIEEPLAARRKIGYLPESTPLYEDLDVLAFLRFMARMQDVPAEQQATRIAELIEICDISRMVHKDISELSKGYRQRVGLAQALLHDPPVLILDEPTSGLDPAQIVEIRELIKRTAEEKCILLSTHILPEAQNTCNRILIINDGALVGEGTSDELMSMAGGVDHYTVTLKGKPAAEITGGLARISGISAVDTLSQNGAARFSLTADKGSQLSEAIFDFAVSQGLKMLELQHESTSLEDVFLQLTGLEHQQGEPTISETESTGQGGDTDE